MASAAVQSLNGQRCSAALQWEGKRQEIGLFSWLDCKKKILMFFQQKFAAHCCTTAAHVFLS
jgi:hypothetical protein